MQNTKVIYYKDSSGVKWEIDFKDAFESWLTEQGGIKGAIEQMAIPVSFAIHLSKEYDGEIVLDDENIDQSFLTDPDFFLRHMQPLEGAYRDRVFQPKKLIPMAIVAFILVYILKSCS